MPIWVDVDRAAKGNWGCTDCNISFQAGSYEAGVTDSARHICNPKQDMKVFESGAKSTVKKPRYDLVPQIAVQMIADRFEYGATRHGARNYRKGKDDPEFVTDRANHLIEHALRYAEHRHREDLEAILCNGAILADIGAYTEKEGA